MIKRLLLVHGLSAPKWLLRPMARFFIKQGFEVKIIHYPSRGRALETMSEHIWQSISPLLSQQWHVVTHSLGGVLMQHILAKHQPKQILSLIMISPPNHGTELYSFFSRYFPLMIRLIGGSNIPLHIQDQPYAENISKEYPCHLILGETRWTISGHLIPKPNDGIISHESMRIKGLQSEQIVYREHLLLIFSKKTYQAILSILNKMS
ncbi:MAG: hypothetical protein CMF42_05430 [Legionellales bacterium]|nr:hypothetical protein [Legionellales bacterium]OUX66854.1 MAG: hypothetical protein CBD38_03775 [bacterium TMED178]|tara:strand:- start:1669 stop:2289 length:621 start_codon:yes stop_codon:yes gene_type:complete